jgi:diacylglycerol kinase
MTSVTSAARARKLADDHTARVHPGSRQTFWQGLSHAIHGVIHVVKHERNARIHLMVAILVLLLGTVLHLTADQLTDIFFAIVLVFLAEIFNTAVERTLDLIDLRENLHIKLVKDMAAGAVLVTAMAAAIIGLVVFGPYVARLVWGN